MVGVIIFLMCAWSRYKSRNIDDLVRYAKPVVRDENPIFFWFHVVVYIAICFLCVYLVINNK
ncbi:MAG: DUF2542 family protein [Oceanobacter sp.]